MIDAQKNQQTEKSTLMTAHFQTEKSTHKKIGFLQFDVMTMLSHVQHATKKYWDIVTLILFFPLVWEPQYLVFLIGNIIWQPIWVRTSEGLWILVIMEFDNLGVNFMVLHAILFPSKYQMNYDIYVCVWEMYDPETETWVSFWERDSQMMLELGDFYK